MRKTIVFKLIISVFAFYWLTTLLFVSPNNYIKISFLEHQETFDTFFFQKWGFFAPPPKHNDRLYFIFESKKDPKISYMFEVIEKLQERKSSKAPFNSSEDILDYVLSSTLHSISDGLFAVGQSLNYEDEVIDSIQNTLDDRIRKGKEYTQSTANFETLKRYAYVVAKRNNIGNIHDYNLTIEITQLDMPKFAERQKLGNMKKQEEKLIFKSDKIAL
ncbi:hypothetical protein [Tenacibaculum xiamenense]|uniref:hypothetical protein n=1 Tax=Tenacibaculum xiamenense TaxID=1261553 RepID=UPI003896805F